MCCQRNKSKIKWHREGRNKEQNICCFALVHTLWARPKMSFRAQSSSLCVEQFSVCLVLGVKRNHVEGTSFGSTIEIISHPVENFAVFLVFFKGNWKQIQVTIMLRFKVLLQKHVVFSKSAKIVGAVKARSEPLFFHLFSDKRKCAWMFCKKKSTSKTFLVTAVL